MAFYVKFRYPGKTLQRSVRELVKSQKTNSLPLVFVLLNLRELRIARSPWEDAEFFLVGEVKQERIVRTTLPT